MKDAFHAYLINGDRAAVNPQLIGTKAAPHYHLTVPAHQTLTLQLRFTNQPVDAAFNDDFHKVFHQRQQEADEFYADLLPLASPDDRLVQRQAIAALLWSKQFYYYEVYTWLQGDSAEPKPSASRMTGRNSHWRMLYAKDVIVMPDAWEYPWFAAWDWSFHCVVLALVDVHFAQQQLLLLCGKRYVNSKGQIPAYEWAFGDVNPPVQAWAFRMN